MFRFGKHRDIITLFHKSSSPASMRIATLLKQSSALASEHATEDQASDHTHQTDPHEVQGRPEFDVEVTEEPPTTAQLQTILEYAGKGNIGKIVKGAKDESEAMKIFKQSAEAFHRPVVVDWNNGHATAAESDSEIIKMLEKFKKDDD